MNNKIFNKLEIKKKRQNLRNNMTNAELILWKYLRNKGILGFRFRRQYSIDKFIVDFYCSQLKLVIEVDGDTHITKEQITYDEHRQKKIEELGIQFLRFTNLDIYNNIGNVIEKIQNKIKELILLTPSTSPLSKGENVKQINLTNSKNLTNL